MKLINNMMKNLNMREITNSCKYASRTIFYFLQLPTPTRTRLEDPSSHGEQVTLGRYFFLVVPL